jgi:hypothetical protein
MSQTPQTPSIRGGIPTALASSEDIPAVTPVPAGNNPEPPQGQGNDPEPVSAPANYTPRNESPAPDPEPKVIEPKTPSYSAALEGYGPSAERYVEDYLIVA